MNTTSPEEIQNYLYEHIPLSKAMEVNVATISDELAILSAPIKPNINHRSTIFGGSASTLAILSAWTLINFRLRDRGITTKLVIQKNTMNYDRPIVDDFEAVCSIEDREIWHRFMNILGRKHKSRITVNSLLRCQGKVVGKFTGTFVALGS